MKENPVTSVTVKSIGNIYNNMISGECLGQFRALAKTGQAPLGSGELFALLPGWIWPIVLLRRK